MGKQRPRWLYYLYISGIIFLSLVGWVVFYSGVAWEDWFFLSLFIVLTVYLQTISLSWSKKMGYTLSTATIFPVLYLFGTTPAMIIAAISALGDGLLNQKDKSLIAFNMAQISLCTLIASLTFDRLGGKDLLLIYQQVIALGLGVVVYTCVNFLLVVLCILVKDGADWHRRLTKVDGRSWLYRSFGTSFVSMIFTFFVAAYSLPGLLIFGILLVQLAELLKKTTKIGSERQIRRELEAELLVDEMTRVFNFRFLTNWLNDPTKEKVTILFLDIDDFKFFNDYYDHEWGNTVLKSITKVIRENVRTNDKVIRYGGDEFVILLPGMDREEGYGVAQRIMTKLGELSPSGTKKPITVSIGIASAPEDTTDKHQLLMAADQAMYEAKNRGKNTICLWTPQQGPT